MKCPVCKTECHSELVCPECGFDDISPVFLSKEDGEAWLENVVLPRRLEYWETLEDFEIEGTELKKYHGEEATVVVPYGIERIGEDAFEFNKNIREVIFPDTLRVIGENAFYASELQAAIFPHGLERIEDWAFQNTALIAVVIPATCKEILASAFSGCFHLKTIHISHGVEYIGENAFSWCTNVEYVTIPSSAVDIEKGAFSTGSPEMKLFIDPRNEKYAVIKSSLIDKAQGKIISGSLCDGIPADADISIIGEDAYQSCKGGDGILTIPPNIRTIEYNAFCACHITKAFIPRTVKTIGNAIFSLVDNCTVFVEAKNKPSQWDANWCDAKKSTVAWGQRWKINYGRPEIILLDKNKYSATLISYSYDEDEDQMKMFIRLTNRSDMQVRFVIADLDIDYDTSTVTHWCTVNPNSETRCEFIFNDSEFDMLYLGKAEEITFNIKVKDEDDQYVFAESEMISLPGFYDPDEDDEDDEDENEDGEDDGELPF